MVDRLVDNINHLNDNQCIKRFKLFTSIDTWGSRAEYIRTGLNYNQWLENFRRAVAHRRYGRQVRIDFTLTLPGLWSIPSILQLAQETNSEILAKVIFSFSPDIILSPLSLPRAILDSRVNSLVADLPAGALKDVLVQLKNRPNFEEQWPEEYQTGLARGKARVLQLEHIRGDNYTLEDILKRDSDVRQWWKNIRSS